MRKLYLSLAIIGFAVPYAFFLAFLRQNGLDLELFVNQLFANNISTFFAVDLIISAATFWVFLLRESQRRQMKNWWLFILATLFIGPSFAWPLFLYYREKRMKEMAAFEKFFTQTDI